MRASASWAWRLLVISAAVTVAIWLIGYLSTILVPVAAAVLLAILLAPTRDFLELRCRCPRGLAVAVSVVGLAAFLVGLVWMAGQQILHGFTDLADQAVVGFAQARDWILDGPLGIDAAVIEEQWDQVAGFLAYGQWVPTAATGALGAAATAGQLVLGLLITVFCTVFFLADGAKVWTWLVRLLPVPARSRVDLAGGRCRATLSAYVRTQGLVALVEAVGIGIAAAFFVPRLAVPIAILVFFGAFIPFAGVVVAGAIAIAVVLVAQGWVAALVMLGVFVLVNQAESHLLQPLMMGHAVSLHPVAVALAVATGSLLAGVIGAFFAVPVTAVLNTAITALTQRGDPDA